MSSTMRRRVVVVSGLSGAGKSSILRALEDLGFEAVDNPPLPLIDELVARGERRLAVGIDARTRGFNAEEVLAALARLRGDGRLRPELVYAWADESALLRRYTETRRRHPLAPQGRVSDGIAAEEALTATLRHAADLVIDTTELPQPGLRRLIEQRFGGDDDVQSVADDQHSLVVSLISFAFPAGLPREADLVFDARFLRNPHYDAALRPRTGLEAAVGAYVEEDPDFFTFFRQIRDLLALVLPRFVQEGKRYATVAIGCTGGRHRSVHIVERLAADLTSAGWRVTRTHRELDRALPGGALPGGALPGGPPPGGSLATAYQSSVQAQEA
jgi:UPF0042 nucleotide-binding protein